MVRTRVPPLVLAVVGVGLTVGLTKAWLDAAGTTGRDTAPWWMFLFLLLMSIAMASIATAVALDPRPVVLRQALAGAALVWVVIAVTTFLIPATSGRLWSLMWPSVLLAAVVGVSLYTLAATTEDGAGPHREPLERFGQVVVFALAILAAAGAAVVVVTIARGLWSSLGRTDGFERLPWALVVLVIVLPLLTFLIASLGTRIASGRTFYDQAAANRRNSVLLLVSLVGIVAATAEIIAITLTFDPIPALWAAGGAVVIGLLAAIGANRHGSDLILSTAGAKPADPRTDAVLLDVVRELSLAADIPVPATYIVEDGSQNAFATGRDPQHASVAVTRGLLQAMDREELQGVLGHELGHIRNLDTRYALYIAVMVGLVALVTDGFLRLVIEGWKNGAFVWKGEGKNAAGALATGLLVGLFLLIVASLLRLFAPLFSALVQASTSREREFLADATSVEFTRNAAGLERALESLAGDHDTLEAANRGTQHLWFRNPVKAGSDRRAGLLSTHPSLGARIDRLRVLQGLAPLDADGTSPEASET